MMRHKNLYRWKDFVFRLTRTEGTVNIHIIKLRACVFFIGIGAIPIIFMFKGKYYDPVYIEPKKIISQKILKEKDDEARAVLFYNR